MFTIFTADHYHSQSNYTYTTPNNVSESKKHLRNSESCTKQHQRTFGTHKTVHALEEMSQSCRLQNVLIVQNISDSSPMLVKCTLKGSFAENRDQMLQDEEHGTKRWVLITSCSLPEVTTGLTGLVFHELYEKNIFEKKYSLEVD